MKTPRSAPVIRRFAPVASVLAVAALTMAPLFWLGYPRGHDWQLELVRVAQWGAALSDGQVLPAWAPDLYHGFGSPIFLFYAPLFAALSWTLGLVLGGPLAGSIGALVFTLAIAGSGALALSRSARDAPRSEPWTAGDRVAVYAVLLGAYVLTDLYIRNANAELLGLALLPWCLAAVVGPRPRPRLLFLVFSLTILAHNLTALVALVLMAALTLGTLRRGRTWKSLKDTATALALALGATSWFWWPALSLKSMIRTDELLTGKFAFSDNFLPFVHTFGFRPPYAVGWLPLLALFSALVPIVLGGPYRRLALIGGMCSLTCMLLMHPISMPIWTALPWLPLFQFPWRFLGALSILTAMLLALVFHRLEGQMKRSWLLAAEAGVLALLAVAALPIVGQIRTLPQDLDLHRQLQPDAVRALPHRSTVGDEYLPANASSDVWRAGPGTIRSKSESTTIATLAESGTHLTLDIDGAGGALVLGRFYFPGWSCSADGYPCSLFQSPEGLLAIGALPYGRHQMELRYRAPASRRLGYLLSLLCLPAALFWFRQFRNSTPA